MTYLIDIVLIIILIQLLRYFYNIYSIFYRKQKLLNNKIKFISRLKDNKDLCVTACQDLAELLNFDYSVISVVDFNSNWLKSIAMAANNKDLKKQHPENWIELSKYNLKIEENEKDILVQVVNSKKTSLVIGRHIYEDDNVILNKQIFSEYKHENLARIYIPILHYNSLKSDNEISNPIINQGELKYFVPNKSLTKNDNLLSVESEQDIILGVLELGIKSKIFNIISAYLNKSISVKLFSLYFLTKTYLTLKIVRKFAEIYIDNFSQIYYTNYYKFQRDEILQKIIPLKNSHIESVNEEYKDYNLYAHKVLKEITVWQKADFGIISFKTFNNNFVSYSEDVILYNINKDKINKLSIKEAEAGITAYVCMTGKSYYSNDVKNDNLYVGAVDGVNSEVVIPLIRNNDVIGIVSLSSYEKNAFVSINIPIIETAVKELLNQFIRKKRYYIYFKLTDPIRIWNNINDLYITIVDQLREYFYCNFVTVWHKSFSAENPYELVYSTDEQLNYDLKKIHFSNEDWNSSFETDTNVVSIVFDYSKINGNLKTFLQERKFKFYIVLKVSNNIYNEGYFMLFSKQDIFDNPFYKKNEDRNLIHNFNIDEILSQNKTSEVSNVRYSKDFVAKNFILKDIDFLMQILRKASISSQNIKMHESINTINQTLLFSHDSAEKLIDDPANKNKFLERIVQAALKATAADIVTLYAIQDNNKTIWKKDAISAISNTNKKFENDRNGRALLANIIVNDNSSNDIFIFNNDEEYFKYIYSSEMQYISKDYRLNSFRTKYNIETTIGIKLRYNKTPIGVIFFNYRFQVKIHEDSDLRKLILDFSRVASVQIFILIQFETELKKLEFQRAALANTNKELEQNRINLSTELNQSQELLEQMIPAATRTSFYLILHAVNHDVGNMLQTLVNTMDALTNKSMLTENGRKVFFPYKNRILNTISVLHNLLDLFDFSDEQESSLKNTDRKYDINEIILQLISFFKNIEPTIDFELKQESLPYINCNKMELSMVIYNIVNNAIYFIKEAKRENGLVMISTKSDSKNLEISILDNGVGIDSSQINNIFLPRYTTKPIGKGLGIGLYFVKQVIENTYNGTIKVKSVVNKSTTFVIQIPKFILHINS